MNLRFDMHLAFKPEVYKELEKWTDAKKDDLIELFSTYRPRVGLFAQAPVCAKNNPSKESVIPTFTCNFFASDFCEAQKTMDKIIGLIKENKVLGDGFLRGRAEGQFSSVRYDVKGETLEFLFNKEKVLEYMDGLPQDNFSKRIKSFPQEVTENEYYDAHIHLLGVDSKEKFIKAALKAAKLEMPIIANLCKKKPKPFITKRWYNTTLEKALISLENVYKELYPQLEKMGVKMQLSPEVEVTMTDPDCQITDRGWMPTPEESYLLTKEHCIPPEALYSNN